MTFPLVKKENSASSSCILTIWKLLLHSISGVLQYLGFLWTMPDQQQEATEEARPKPNLMTLPQEIRDIIFAYAFSSPFCDNHILAKRRPNAVNTPVTRPGHEYRLIYPYQQSCNLRVVPSTCLSTITVSENFYLDDSKVSRLSAMIGPTPSSSHAGERYFQKVNTASFFGDSFRDALANAKEIYIPSKAHFALEQILPIIRHVALNLEQIILVDEEPYQWIRYDSFTPRPHHTLVCDTIERYVLKLLKQEDLQSFIGGWQLPTCIRDFVFADKRMLFMEALSDILEHDSFCAGAKLRSKCDCTKKNAAIGASIKLRRQVDLKCNVGGVESRDESSASLSRRMTLLTLLVDIKTRGLCAARVRFEH